MPLSRHVAAPKDRLQHLLKSRFGKWLREDSSILAPGAGLAATQPTGADIKIVRLPGEEDAPEVQVGRYSSLNWQAKVLVGGGHRTDWVSTYNLAFELGLGSRAPGVPTTRGPVVIGNDVWIGWEALILSGVTIGDGAVIGARAVITKDVEPYAIVVGSPQQQKGWRFDADTRAALLRIKWWDWPQDKVIDHIPQINSSEVSTFVASHDPAATEPRVPCSACLLSVGRHSPG